MDIRILNDSEVDTYADKILSMLVAGDKEFVPPLSARSSTTQSDLSASKSTPEGIANYFEEMKKQKILVALEDGEVIGFCSFRDNYKTDIVNIIPNIYISTLIVDVNARGKGLTRKMYSALFEEYKKFSIFTRTWSTNYAHIKILSTFGFDTLHTIKNDRGEGIDTVYFVKHPAEMEEK